MAHQESKTFLIGHQSVPVSIFSDQKLQAANIQVICVAPYHGSITISGLWVHSKVVFHWSRPNSFKRSFSPWRNKLSNSGKIWMTIRATCNASKRCFRTWKSYLWARSLSHLRKKRITIPQILLNSATTQSTFSQPTRFALGSAQWIDAASLMWSTLLK